MISVIFMTNKLKINSKVLFLICSFVLFSMALAPSIVLAHSPNSMTLEYNEDTNQLDVTITHPVPDNSTHYIEEVQIKVNSTLNQPYEYTSQPGNTFTYSYTIEAAPGTRFEVKATCSVSGDMTRSIVVSGGPNTSTPTIPLNTGVILLSMLIGTALLVFKQYKLSKYRQ
jgi:hypothetical protein